MHFYMGDWSDTETGCLGRLVGWNYEPGTPLHGFRQYEGESTSTVFRVESKIQHYTDHRDLAVFFLGVLVPGVLLIVAGFLYLGGRQENCLRQGL
jgi:hypothetical protein